MANLPEEIVAEILSRLPVSSLCRFRCVSKSWRSLISEPNFIRLHLNHNTTTTDHHRLILISDFYKLYSVDLHSPEFTQDSIAIYLKFPPDRNPNRFGQICGSCDGLLLMRDYISYFLLNPSTRESKEVPNSPFSVKSGYSFNLNGFGHDSSKDDYKVVRISHCDCAADCAENIVSVFSLRTNTWRRIEDSPYDHSFHERLPGVFVSGAVHWLACTTGVGSNDSTVIASLDLAKEKFQSVPCPGSAGDILIEELGVLGGCLCALGFCHSGCQDVWVMKKYGVRDSWTKFTINYGNFPFWNPLCFSRTGQVLLESGHSLVIFDQEEKTFKELKVKGRPAQFKAGVYVESLVQLQQYDKGALPSTI
ncbi:F-box protein CPR1-like [Diospyros lotus]|uniref:F-box protein CPR1-like n=1 Tax=Diospyros lotus TaxID=55363 RepID=UPI0022590815|nr:F-box protein CPR1-like [Diospyros lotus]XP_052194552.1 F-box protein CPR1-like [Diospyros lotus]XP_052194553.1 F-box protein CPR1-like [Diospyros lotus]